MWDATVGTEAPYSTPEHYALSGRKSLQLSKCWRSHAKIHWRVAGLVAVVLLATGKRGGALGREVVNVSFPAPLFFAPPLYTPFSSSLPSHFPGTHRLQHIGPLACLENRCALFSTTALPQSSESKERERKNKTVPFQQFSRHPPSL